MGEGVQWFLSTIADLPEGGLQWGEGLQYNTGPVTFVTCICFDGKSLSKLVMCPDIEFQEHLGTSILLLSDWL